MLEVLAAEEHESIINRPDISQPCTTALQVSLVRLWRHWGIRPDVVLGHSSGEIATAYAAGALTLEQTILTAVSRGIPQFITYFVTLMLIFLFFCTQVRQ